MTRPLLVSLAIAALAALPARAADDGVGAADFAFRVVAVGLCLVVAAVLAGIAFRQTARGLSTTGAVFRSGVIGVLAVCACAIAARFSNQFAAALAVPALMAVPLLASARSFGRLGARALRAISAIAGVVCVALSVLGFAFWIEELSTPPEERMPSDVRALRERCDAGDAGGCLGLGTRLRDGSGVLANDAAAADAFRKACTLRSPPACRALAGMHHSGKGVPKDAAAADALRKEADTIEASASRVP